MASNFGGSIVGASVSNSVSDGGALTPVQTPAGKVRKTMVAGAGTAGIVKRQTESAARSSKAAPVEEIKQSSEAIGAQISLKYAFGSNSASVDALQSFSVSTSGSDKDNSDKVLFRVGKQVCIFSTENNSQQFLEGRSRKVKNILHFCYSANTKYVAACETLRVEKDDETPAQISVYNLVSNTKYKTLTLQCNADFVQSVFCGDQKFLAALTGDSDRQVIQYSIPSIKLGFLLTLIVASSH